MKSNASSPPAGTKSQGDHTIRFMEKLRNPEGTEWAGKKLKLLHWQKAYIQRLLNTCTPEGRQQYEQSLLFLPKKQGKSTFIAALAVALLFRRRHQQIACVANTKEQASILFKFAKSMIEQDPTLSDPSRCKIYKGNTRRIDCYYSDSTLTVYASEATNVNGLNCSILVYDEVCFETNGDLWDAMVSGGINRKHVLAIGLSTAGFQPVGFGYNLYLRSKQILANPELDPTFLPVIYEAPPDADWTNIQTFIDCSPTFREIGADAIPRIERMIASAKNNPSELKKLLRYHLNQWVGAESKESWLQLAAWDACPNDVTLEMLKGRECYAGLDLASVKDLTALCLLFPLEEGRYAVLLWFYMAADNIAEKERRDPGAMYTTWQRLGYLTATPGDWTDYGFIRADLKRLRTQYQIMGIAVDRVYNSAQISQDLLEDGHNVVPIGQGTLTVAPAAREMETLVVSKRLIHLKNPILRWNVSNCVAKVVDDAGNVKPSKAKSTGRIDGVYAVLDAVALEMANRSKGTGVPDCYIGGGGGGGGDEDYGVSVG